MPKIILSGEPKSTSTIYKYHCKFGTPSGYLSAQGKELKEQYSWEVKSQWKKEILKGNLEVDIKIFFKSQRVHDVDNFNKLILDSMSGIVYEDDGQIWKMTVSKWHDKQNPRIEVEISEVK